MVNGHLKKWSRIEKKTLIERRLKMGNNGRILISWNDIRS